MEKITKNGGYNESENILAELCEKTFLKLWSYPSLFRDDGKGRNGVGKELCDLLIVFGNDIVIFSDKHITYQINNEEGVAWGRWKRSAINDSAKQLIGTKKWIKKLPSRIFLDHNCTSVFPFFRGKDISEYNFHLVAIANGLPSEKRIIINTSQEELVNFETQYTFSNEFIHIFDTKAFENITKELDTSKDFIDYLNKRKETLLNVKNIYCKGEENLLAEYLLREDIPLSVFKSKRGKKIRDCEYMDLINSHDYKNGKILDKNSYLWDYLIDNIATHLMEGSLITYVDNSLDEKKMVIEKMASYDRLSRREHAMAIMKKYTKTPPLAMSSFLIHSGDHVFSFIITPSLPFKKKPNMTHEKYINSRLDILQAYCSAWYEEHKCDVVAVITDNLEIPIEHPNEKLTKLIFQKGISTLYRKSGELSQGEKDNLEYIRSYYGILAPKRIVKSEWLSKQYPDKI
ncbi:hypothetical protein RDT67_28785 [Serratia fonticola]|uniref:Uncharacterized protein n=1 Tax=Serratia fonticola TaxID=47917 RepID=A0AAJ1YLP8_SERFO|nr:hypothetical protein [Serratia fonticola]MDQ9130400.1 hypothetical protein [Serratia fonticola]